MLAFAFALSALIAGCGGGGGDKPNSGRLVFRVHWPERSRLTPLASESVLLHFFGRKPDEQPVVSNVLLVRPAAGSVSDAAFENLQPGPVSVQAEAYPNADGTGIQQGVMVIAPNIVRSETTEVNADFASTVTEVNVDIGQSLVPGQTFQAGVYGSNNTGNIVLIAAQALQWSSSNPASATVDAAGSITAIAPGKTLITALDKESKHTGAATVLVSAPPTATNVFASVQVSTPGKRRLELREYTPAGEIVRSVPLPQLGGVYFDNPALTVNSEGKVLALNGEQNVYLNAYDPASNQWDSRPLTGISRKTIDDYAPLASFGHDVFVIDASPPTTPGVNGVQLGSVVRYDLSTGEMRRFGDSRCTSVAMGWDGALYAVQRSYDFPTDAPIIVRSIIYAFDPTTLTERRRITLPYAIGDVAVNSAGVMYANSRDNGVLKMAMDGTILGTFYPQSNGYDVNNLQLDRNGRLTMGGRLINITEESFLNPTVIAPYGTDYNIVSVTSAAPGQ